MQATEPHIATVASAFFNISPRMSEGPLALSIQPQPCCAVEESEHTWLAELLAEHWPGLKKATAKQVDIDGERFSANVTVQFHDHEIKCDSVHAAATGGESWTTSLYSPLRLLLRASFLP
jgi:hypothetical protein